MLKMRVMLLCSLLCNVVQNRSVTSVHIRPEGPVQDIDLIKNENSAQTRSRPPQNSIAIHADERRNGQQISSFATDVNWGVIKGSNFSALLETLVWKTHPTITATRSTQDSQKSGGKNFPSLLNLRRTIKRDSQRADDNQRAYLTHGSKSGDRLRQNNELSTVGRRAGRQPEKSAKTDELISLHIVQNRATPHEERRYEVDGRTDNEGERGQQTNAISQKNPSATIQGASHSFTAVTDPKPPLAERSSYGRERVTEEKRSREARSFDAGPEVTVDAPTFGLVDVVVNVGAASEVRRKLTGPSATEQGYRSKDDQLDPLSVQTLQDAPIFPCVTCSSFASPRFAPGKSKSTTALTQPGDGTVRFPAASHLPSPPGVSKEKIISLSIASFHAGEFIGAKEENIPLEKSTREENERGRVALTWLRTATKEYSPEGRNRISMVGDQRTKGQAGRSQTPGIAADIFESEEAKMGEEDTTTVICLGVLQVQSPNKIDFQSSLNVDTKTILPDSYEREMYQGIPYAERSMSNNRKLIRNKFTPFVSLASIPAIVQHRVHPYNTNSENALTQDVGSRLSFHFYVPRQLSPLLVGPPAMIHPATTATLTAAVVSQESSDVGPNQRSQVIGEDSGSDATQKRATKPNQARAATKVKADDHSAVADPARDQPDSFLNTRENESLLFDAERLANGSLAVKNQGIFSSVAEKQSIPLPTKFKANTYVANLSKGDSLQSLAGASSDHHSIVNTGRRRRNVDSETVNGSGEEDNTSKIKMIGSSEGTLTSSQTTLTIVLATVEGGNEKIKGNSLADHYGSASVTTNSNKNDDASTEHILTPSTTARDAPTSSTDSGSSKLQEAGLSSVASTSSMPFSLDNLVTPLDTDSPTMSQTKWPGTPEHSYTDPSALPSSASATDGAEMKPESSTTTQLTTTANVEKPNTKSSTTTGTSEDSTSATTSATDSAAEGTASQPQPGDQPTIVDAQVSDLAAKVTSAATTASTTASTPLGQSLVTSTTVTSTANAVTATYTSAASTAASQSSDATVARSTLHFADMSTTAEAELLPELESGYTDPDPDPEAEGEDSEAGIEQEKGSETKGNDWQLPKSERFSVWDTDKAAHYGVWWQVHLYAFAALFWLLAAYSLVCLLRLWPVKRLLPGLHFLVVHLLALTLCGTRVAYLTVAEGYNRAETLHASLDYFLYSAPFPCLSAAFGLLVLSLFRAARGRLLTQSDHKLTWLAVIVVAHFALTVAAAVVVGMTAGMKILLLVCQLFFILWGSFLFLGYIFIFRRLYVHALKRQMVCEQTAISGACGVGRPVKSRLTLGAAVKVTLLTAALGLVMVGMAVYGVVGVHWAARLVSADDPPWLCYLYHTALRLLEVTMCAALLYVDSLPYRYQRVEKGGCCLTLCAPCVVMCCCCCCCCRDADDTGPKADPADRPDVDNHQPHHFQQQQQLGDASQSERSSCAISLNLGNKLSWQKPLLKRSSQGKADGQGYIRRKPGDVTPIVGALSDSRLTSDSEERTTSTRGSLTSGGAAEEEREISTPLLATTSPYKNAYPSDRVTALFADAEAAGDPCFWALENRISMNNNCLKSGEGSCLASTGREEAGAGSRPRFSSCGSSDLYIPPPGTLTLADSMDQELDRAFQSMHEADASPYLPMSRDGPADSPLALPQPQTPVRCPDRTLARQGATAWELSRENGGDDASGQSIVPCLSSTPRSFTDYDSKANWQKPLSDKRETTAEGHNPKIAPPKPRNVSEQLTRVKLQPQQEDSEHQARSDDVCRETDGGSNGSDVDRPALRSSAGHSVAAQDGILDTVRDRSATAVDVSHRPVSPSWDRSQADEACDLRNLKPQHNDVRSSPDLSNKDNGVFGDFASEWFSEGSVSQPNSNKSGNQSQNSDVSKPNAYQTSGHLHNDRTLAAKGDDLDRFDNFASQELSARAFPSRPKAVETGGAAISFTEDSDEIEV